MRKLVTVAAAMLLGAGAGAAQAQQGFNNFDRFQVQPQIGGGFTITPMPSLPAAPQFTGPIYSAPRPVYEPSYGNPGMIDTDRVRRLLSR